MQYSSLLFGTHIASTLTAIFYTDFDNKGQERISRYEASSLYHFKIYERVRRLITNFVFSNYNCGRRWWWGMLRCWNDVHSQEYHCFHFPSTRVTLVEMFASQ